MENNIFTELTVNESLEIDAGAFSVVSIAKPAPIIVCYGVLLPSQVQ